MSHSTNRLKLFSRSKKNPWTGSIRIATLNDIEPILIVEREAFTAPWPRSAFICELTENSQSQILVAEEGGIIVGFMVYWSVAGEFHLLNLAVHPMERGRGIGLGLMEYLIETAVQTGQMEIILEVRASNRPAYLLYKRFGFRALAIRPKYYVDNGEDAIVMSLQLPDFAAWQRRRL